MGLRTRHAVGEMQTDCEQRENHAALAWRIPRGGRWRKRNKAPTTARSTSMAALRPIVGFGRRHRVTGLVAAVGIATAAGFAGAAMASTVTGSATKPVTTGLSLKAPSSVRGSRTKQAGSGTKKSRGGSGSTGSTGSGGSTGSTGSAGPPATGSWWTPNGSIAQPWQWELGHPLSLTSAADLGTGSKTYTGAAAPAPTVYDIDGFDNTAATVAGLHGRGAHVICYLSVGTYENWRPDATSFPSGLLGAANGWPGEQWLNVSPTGPYYAQLQSVIAARLQMCAAKGFDAVEFDNMDGSENSTGFAISNAQNNQYVEWLAATAHALGLAAFQKNDVDQSTALQPFLDGAIDEQCFQYNECTALQPYLTAHKPVLEAEYASVPSSYCPTANLDNINAVRFDLNLDAAVRVTCR
jgi:Glycoside-hydrolase family GH114